MNHHITRLKRFVAAILDIDLDLALALLVVKEDHMHLFVKAVEPDAALAGLNVMPLHLLTDLLPRLIL